MTTFLRFPDEDTAKSILPDWYSNEYGWQYSTIGQSIDVIGTINLEEYDAEGNVVVSSIQLEGWHVNILGDVPEEAIPYVVAPTTPFRIFAGY